jgi:Tol biopolymer transport system component
VGRFLVAILVSIALVVVAAAAGEAPATTALVYEHGATLGHPLRGTVWRARTDGTHAVALTTGLDPVLSPDGRWIAFRRGYHELWLIGADGAREQRLRLATGFISGIVWSPDSIRLAVLERDGLAIVDRRNRTGRILVPRQLEVNLGSPSFSPEGTRLAYSRVDSTGGDVYVVAIGGGKARRLTTNRRSFDPVWGPSSIAFSRFGPKGDIWIVRADGSGARRLTHTRSGIRPVAWSGDGNRLLAANAPVHNGRLWAVDARSGQARNLTGWVGDLFPQGLSRDGTRVLAAIGCGGILSRDGVLELLPFSGGPPTVVARGPCRGSWNA